MKKFLLYLLLVFQVLWLIFLSTIGLLLYLVVTDFLTAFVTFYTTDKPPIENILYWLLLSFIYFGMIFFNIVSLKSTMRLIKNKALSLFNKISFIVFALTVIFICWLWYTPEKTSVDKRFLKVYHTNSYFYSGVNLRRV